MEGKKYARNNINVKSNLTYSDDTYTQLSQAPKLIIYAENNIIIDCEVTRIDALLKAKKVTTCNSDDVNSQRNSAQLTINGAIMSNSLTANRTYGAGRGSNSMVSAEIINFDPTLYLWGGNNTDADDAGTVNYNMDAKAMHDLAPRY